MREDDSVIDQQLFDFSEAKAEAMIQPHSVTDELAGKQCRL